MSHAIADRMIAVMRDKLAEELEGKAYSPVSEYAYEWDEDWESWNMKMFPKMYSPGFARHHGEFWSWAWKIKLGVSPKEPFIGIWSRGGGKSTSAEGGTVALGVRGQRRYCLYVRSTQTMADTSVGNIAAMLEGSAVEKFYPDHAKRMMGKFGSSKGWRRNRIRTRGGFTIDALGLDVAARGVKMEEQRPDLIVFDDIDELHDSPLATKKKIATLTKSLLPAGSKDVAIMGIQNLIIPHGVFAQLEDGRADFLVKRRVSGPHPALRDMKTEMKKRDGKVLPTIVSGEPVWKGQGVSECQDLMDTIGLRAFNEEAQHQVHEREGALWTKDTINHITEMPPLKRSVVAGDPSGGGDDIGIVGAGVTFDGRGVVFVDRTQPGGLGPLNWGRAMVDTYDEFEMDKIIAERNYGGDMVESNIKAAAGQRRIPFEFVNASRSKMIRAEPVASLYEDGLVDHYGPLVELEIEMTSWVPGDPWSPNRLDALVWCLSYLMLKDRKQGMRWGSGTTGNKVRR